MRAILSVLLALSISATARADNGKPSKDGAPILQRVLANRVIKDFSLKARLFMRGKPPVFLTILVKNTPSETRTLYRSGNTELLVIQPVQGEVHYYLSGVGALTGKARLTPFLGSDFACYDLGLPFLHWTHARLLGEKRYRAQDCYVVEVSASGEPYARVKLWIDKQYYALLRAEAYDKNGDLVRRFSVSSFRKIGNVWIPRGMEDAYVPPGQAMPSEEKSRLEIYEGSYDENLPAADFDPARFTAKHPAGAATEK